MAKMKKMLSMFMAFAVLFPFTVSASADEVFQIGSQADLLEFARLVRTQSIPKPTGSIRKSFLNAELTADIIITDHEWQTIGAPAPFIEYYGTFDGKGHSISGLRNVDSGNHNIALFYNICEGGVLKNLTLNVYFIASGKTTVGGAAALLTGGRIENVAVNGLVGGASLVGGIVGSINSGTAANSLLSSKGVISRCVNNATIIGTDSNSSAIGGITGNGYLGTMEYCANHGDVIVKSELTSATSVGGLIAGAGGSDKEDYSIKLYNCYNVGFVSQELNGSGDSLGGIIGGFSILRKTKKEFINFFNYGTVWEMDGAKSCSFTGGIDTSDGTFQDSLGGRFLNTSGRSLFFMHTGTAQGEDGWGTEFIKTIMTSHDVTEFRDETVLGQLLEGPGGAGKWKQGIKYPVLAFEEVYPGFGEFTPNEDGSLKKVPIPLPNRDSSDPERDFYARVTDAVIDEGEHSEKLRAAGIEPEIFGGAAVIRIGADEGQSIGGNAVMLTGNATDVGDFVIPVTRTLSNGGTETTSVTVRINAIERDGAALDAENPKDAISAILTRDGGAVRATLSVNADFDIDNADDVRELYLVIDGEKVDGSLTEDGAKFVFTAQSAAAAKSAVITKLIYRIGVIRYTQEFDGIAISETSVTDNTGNPSSPGKPGNPGDGDPVTPAPDDGTPGDGAKPGEPKIDYLGDASPENVPASGNVSLVVSAGAIDAAGGSLAGALADAGLGEMEGSVTLNGSGAVVADATRVSSGLSETDRNALDAEAGIISLPVFTATLPEGKTTAAVTFAVGGLGEFDGRRVGDVEALKVVKTGKTIPLARAASLRDITAGEFVVTDRSGRSIPPETAIDQALGAEFFITVAIEDNSELDWDAAAGSIADPLALGVRSQNTGGGASSSGSNGCGIGFGAISLLAAGAAMALRGRERE